MSNLFEDSTIGSFNFDGAFEPLHMCNFSKCLRVLSKNFLKFRNSGLGMSESRFQEWWMNLFPLFTILTNKSIQSNPIPILWCDNVFWWYLVIQTIQLTMRLTSSKYPRYWSTPFSICNILNVRQVNCTVIKSSMVYLPILPTVLSLIITGTSSLFNLKKM